MVYFSLNPELAQGFLDMLPEILLLLHLSLVQPRVLAGSSVALASHSFSLEDRYANSFVNGVFKDNILLAMNYMDGAVKDKADVDWDKVESPFHYEFSLEPGQEFAFHDKTLPEYSLNLVKTTDSRFNWDDGYKSDGYLTGDGVCHLASLIYWSAKDAGLDAIAPRNHDFAKIPEVPKEYGVAILSTDPNQNLYIINNLTKKITFGFDYDGANLTVSVTEAN